MVWLLLILTVVATFFIQRHKVTAVPPSAAAMAIGIVVGVIVTTAGQQSHIALLIFNSHMPFLGLSLSEWVLSMSSC